MINMIRRAMLLIGYGTYLKNPDTGFAAFVSRMVGSLQSRVSKIAHLSKSSGLKIKILKGLYDDRRSPDYTNKIPAHRVDQDRRKRRIALFFVVLLLVAEATFNYYALAILIAPGENGGIWLVLRMILSVIVTGMSTLSAERFFRHYRHQRFVDLKLRFEIYDGQEMPEKQEVDTRVWFFATLACAVVLVALSVIRMGALEGADPEDAGSYAHYASVILFPILAVTLMVVGGALVFEIELYNLVISTFQESRKVANRQSSLREALVRVSTDEARALRDALMKEARTTYSAILDFEALFNSRRAKMNLPPVSRQQVPFIETFNRFVDFVANELAKTQQEIVNRAMETLRTELSRTPDLESSTGQDGSGHRQPGDDADLSTVVTVMPDGPPKPRLNGGSTKLINFEKNSDLI